MQNLIDYLTNLNSSDSTWGIWVNPQNLDDYRIGQRIFDNGGAKDNFEYIGNLEELSFGHQSLQDAVKAVLENNSFLHYQGKKVKFNADSMYEAWESDCLDGDFQQFLESEAAEYQSQSSLEEAESKVTELHFYFTGENFQKELMQRKLEAEAWASCVA